MCPYSAHRFLFQHHESFAADVQVFLSRTNALLQISSTFVMAELHGNSRHDPARPDADVRTPPPRPGDGSGGWEAAGRSERTSHRCRPVMTVATHGWIARWPPTKCRLEGRSKRASSSCADCAGLRAGWPEPDLAGVRSGCSNGRMSRWPQTLSGIRFCLMARPHTGGMGLVEPRGRHVECERLDLLLTGARTGRSGVLVIRGEAGIGKSELLRYAVQSASDLQVMRVAGVESEMELPFAALHQLCAPMLDHVGRLPSPQRDALATVFGLSGGSGTRPLPGWSRRAEPVVRGLRRTPAVVRCR